MFNKEKAKIRGEEFYADLKEENILKVVGMAESGFGR